MSEKCLGTEVPVDFKSVRIGRMVLPGCNEINSLRSEGPWVYKRAHPGDQRKIPDLMETL